MARILETDVFRMAEAGDSETAVEDLLAMLGFGPQAAETPFLVSGLVGLATNGIAYNTIGDILSEYPDLLDDRQLEMIAQKLASHSPRKLIRYQGEVAFQKDMIQRMYSDDGSGDGRLTDEGLTMLPMLKSLTSNLSENDSDSFAETMTHVTGPGLAFVGGSRKELADAIDGVMKDMIAEFGGPFHERSARESVSFDQILDKHAPHDLTARTFIQMMIPALDQISVARERVECHRNGTMIYVAANRFRLQHDRFPETVDELVPEFLKEVPVDVLTGQPLLYQLRDGQPVIYSVGADGDDDGGVEAVNDLGNPLEVHLHFQKVDPGQADGDWVLWPATE